MMNDSDKLIFNVHISPVQAKWIKGSTWIYPHHFEIKLLEKPKPSTDWPNLAEFRLYQLTLYQNDISILMLTKFPILIEQGDVIHTFQINKYVKKIISMIQMSTQ